MTVTRLGPEHAGLCPALSDLCFRSKARWGYDSAFMEQARDALTVRPADFADLCAMTGTADRPTGYVRVVRPNGGIAELDDLFIAPDAQRMGLGRALWDWACVEARMCKAHTLRIVSDPYAAQIYRNWGAVDAGEAPSNAIPGQTLPILHLPL